LKFTVGSVEIPQGYKREFGDAYTSLVLRFNYRNPTTGANHYVDSNSDPSPDLNTGILNGE